MTSPLFSGPIAPERNPTVRETYYSPRLGVISSITSDSTTQTTIVTDDDNQMVVGQLVRFVIANNCGMEQLNETQALVVSITDSTTFSVNYDTTTMNAFNSSGNTKQSSMVLPIGDVNSGAINSSGRINNGLYIEGSFINVSPG